jgi:hypothetical protein
MRGVAQHRGRVPQVPPVPKVVLFRTEMSGTNAVPRGQVPLAPTGTSQMVIGTPAILGRVPRAPPEAKSIGGRGPRRTPAEFRKVVRAQVV